jgi:putative transposase
MVASLYKRHRFPHEIIQYAFWLYNRFNPSHQDIEDLLTERGITVIYESIRLWCNKFGQTYAKRLKERHLARISHQDHESRRRLA